MHVNFCDVDSLLPFRCLAPGGINFSLSLSLSVMSTAQKLDPAIINAGKAEMWRKLRVHGVVAT
jgi:hypothetical protein